MRWFTYFYREIWGSGAALNHPIRFHLIPVGEIVWTANGPEWCFEMKSNERNGTKYKNQKKKKKQTDDF